MSTLALPPALRLQLEREARGADPRECCGLIEGATHPAGFEALALHPARNLSADDSSFEIAPADHIPILRAARTRRTAIIGCYHSHPNGRPEPSARDLAGAAETGFVWLIVALRGAEDVEIGAYVFDGKGFSALTLTEAVSLDPAARSRV
ncbi:MAG: M67 family metallopeptidase [Rhizomicrobium sp.]